MLQAMYGANFAYFDPNIWWNEDEMRKQIEQLNGCFVLTGWVCCLALICRRQYDMSLSPCVFSFSFCFLSGHCRTGSPRDKQAAEGGSV